MDKNTIISELRNLSAFLQSKARVVETLQLNLQLGVSKVQWESISANLYRHKIRVLQNSIREISEKYIEISKRINIIADEINLREI